jgi:hypothetical protein
MEPIETQGSKARSGATGKTADARHERLNSSDQRPRSRSKNETGKAGYHALGETRAVNKRQDGAHEPASVREGFGILLRLARALASG